MPAPGAIEHGEPDGPYVRRPACLDRIAFIEQNSFDATDILWRHKFLLPRVAVSRREAGLGGQVSEYEPGSYFLPPGRRQNNVNGALGTGESLRERSIFRNLENLRQRLVVN